MNMKLLSAQLAGVAGGAGAGFPAGILRLDYRSPLDECSDWALILPPPAGNRWICFLHGHGSHGDQLYRRRDLRERMLPEFWARGYGILTPNLRDDAWMGPAAVADLTGLLDFMQATFGAARFVFASGSMGGTGNLIYAALHPERVAGVVARGAAADPASYYRWCRSRQAQWPILAAIASAIESAYGGPPERVPAVYRRHSALHNCCRLEMPVWLLHGAGDRIIPVAQARTLAAAMHGAPKFRYLEIPHGDHDSPLFFQTDPHPLDWIASFQKGDAEGG